MNDRATHSSRFGAWLDHHGYSIVASLGRLLRKPWATLLTIGVMAVALALPLGLWVVLGNMARLGGEVRESREIAVFLKQAIQVRSGQPPVAPSADSPVMPAPDTAGAPLPATVPGTIVAPPAAEPPHVPTLPPAARAGSLRRRTCELAPAVCVLNRLHLARNESKESSPVGA